MRVAAILFFIIPLLEMIILIQVGSLIGALPTVALVVLTAIVGITLLRHEGIATLSRVQDRLNRGEIPETELLEGIMLIFGGALLLTPGFATDTIGFVCLLPGLRRPIAKRIISSATFRGFEFRSAQFGQHAGSKPSRDIIEGEFESHDPKETLPPGSPRDPQ